MLNDGSPVPEMLREAMESGLITDYSFVDGHVFVRTGCMEGTMTHGEVKAFLEGLALVRRRVDEEGGKWPS